MSGGTQATWGGRFSEGPAELMVRFSESVSFDRRLALFDIQGSQAHARMLAKVGILTEVEADAIYEGLEAIRHEIEAGTFVWQESLEDVHMNIEQALTARVPAGAKLHTARSRNDQVATDMRLWFKYACAQIVSGLRETIGVLLEAAEAHQTVYIPGYTHLQRAQPVSMAHHLLAYVEMLGRDMTRFQRVSEDANWCPLGSGAIAGTTLPIDRELSARLLGFVDGEGNPQVTPNSMDAVADRDLFLDFTHACATCGVHLSRIAEDLILWSSSEFGFVSLPDAFTTGSSLMPQKKNPDALELIRGKSGRLHGHATALFAMVKGLPLTYNRDLQEDKPPVFDAFDTTLSCLAVLAGTIKGLKARPEQCAHAVSDPALLATDVVDYLVRKGVSFRDAHHVVGALVAAAEKAGVRLPELPAETVRAIHPQLDSDWTGCFDVERALAARERPGMPGPKQTASRIAYWKSRLNLS